MTHSFRWLHLTDLHWGHSAQEKDWDNFEGEFRDDLRRVLGDKRVNGKIDAVFFTGDLVNKGTQAEFSHLNEFLEELWEWFADLDMHPYFFPVPGNHDLTRPDQSHPSIGGLDMLRTHQNPQQDFWEKKALLDVHQLIETSFANYQTWWGKLPTAIRKPELIQPGYFPGEYAASVEIRGMKIGVLGLNSAVAHVADRAMPGHVLLNEKQMTQACSSKFEKWSRSHRACFLLSHHPPSWFGGPATIAYESIYKTKRFAAHLFGHVHEQKEERQQAYGAKHGRLKIFGNSLFGYWQEEGVANPDRRYGYAVGQLEAKEEGRIRLWPRHMKTNSQTKDWTVDKSDDWTYDRQADDEGTEAIPTAILPQEKARINWPFEVPDSKPYPSGPRPEVLETKTTTNTDPEWQGMTPFERAVVEGLADLFKDEAFEEFSRILGRELRFTGNIALHMVKALGFKKSVSGLSNSIHAMLKQPGFGSVEAHGLVLDRIAEAVCWLVTTAVKPDWQPEIRDDVPETIRQILLFVPAMYEWSIEIGFSRLRTSHGPAKLIFEKGQKGRFSVEGIHKMPCIPDPGPQLFDYLNELKACIYLTLKPRDAAFVYEIDGKGKRAKPFTVEMDNAVRAELTHSEDSTWVTTPFLLIDPVLIPFGTISEDVITALSKDLHPLKVICLSGEGDMWKDDLTEEIVTRYLRNFYEKLDEAYDKIKGKA